MVNEVCFLIFLKPAERTGICRNARKAEIEESLILCVLIWIHRAQLAGTLAPPEGLLWWGETPGEPMQKYQAENCSLLSF